jgi:uncharacterized protein YnzC (UPF0291/DUF896 family)
MFINLIERINEDIKLLEKNKEVNEKELERKYKLREFYIKTNKKVKGF